MNSDNQLLQIAPMMNRTDQHFRMLLRIVAPDALLYTEMVVADAIRYGASPRSLTHSPLENPLIVQFGGSDPETLVIACKKAEREGFAGINLNVGCPSNRVQKGNFGVCLMLKPDLVCRCIEAMMSAVDIPISVKCRLGVDEHDRYEFLSDFIQRVHGVGVNHFIIHARKAILGGLTPAQNRTIPPLNYGSVRQIKIDYPDLQITLNGGLTTTSSVNQALSWADGVMIGRAAYENPRWIHELNGNLFRKVEVPFDPLKLVDEYMPYMQSQLNIDTPLKHMTRHLLNLFNGQPGAKSYRRKLTDQSRLATAGLETLRNALREITAF